MPDYSNLINVRDGVAERIPVPDYLFGLAPEDLASIDWIGPTYPAYGSAWWPEEFAEDAPAFGYKWGEETFEVVPDRQVVRVHREQVPMTPEELAAQRAEELARMVPLIDAERGRRTAMGFVYDGKAYQTENQSQIDDILGKMTDALAAITIDQAQPGDLRWASPDYDFAWSAADGTLVPMDAQTCLAFTRSAVRRKTLLVGAGLALKAMNPIPTDYMDDKYWPPLDSTAKTARK